MWRNVRQVVDAMQDQRRRFFRFPRALKSIASEIKLLNKIIIWHPVTSGKIARCDWLLTWRDLT